MHTLLLQPNDVLFFRDGRPMEGGLAGHGAAWPLPTVLDGALHAALHRSGIQAREHRHQRDLKPTDNRVRRYGDLTTAGPFPVGPDGIWYLPLPLDLDASRKQVRVLPFPDESTRLWSSLPAPLIYALRSTLPPKKDAGDDDKSTWISSAALSKYLAGEGIPDSAFQADSDLLDREATIGIGMDSDRGVQDGQRFYSAQYMRLRDGWSLGCLVGEGEKNAGAGLVRGLFPEKSRIIIGGQQRVCTVAVHQVAGSLPLPWGKRDGFSSHSAQHLVKWVLLTPAIWPAFAAGHGHRDNATTRKGHPGGWLPNWIDAESGAVLLRVVSSDLRKVRRSLNAGGTGYRTDHGNAAPIRAHLVSALVPKPVPVTGWAVENPDANRAAGPKATHLAVPAGAVYYFSCDTADDARALAAALNWHGDGTDASVRIRRRSTLFGEKGFGIGVCGTWSPHPAAAHPTA